MTEQSSPGLEGTPIEEAVDAVANAGDDRDAVERALSHVAADGVVSTEGAERGLSTAAMHLSDLEQRVGMLADRFQHARSMAMPSTDLEVVRERIDRFETRLDAIERDRREVAEAFQDLQESEEPESLLERGQALDELMQNAEAVHRRLEQSREDLQRLEQWLHEPRHRFQELAEDANALTATLDELEQQVAALDEQDIEDPETAWLDANFRQRLASVLVADVRFELEELTEWSAPTDQVDEDGVAHPERIESDIEAAAEAVDRLAERLESVARPEWVEEYEETLTAIDEELDPLEPPMDWATVEEIVRDHRSRVDALETAEE